MFNALSQRKLVRKRIASLRERLFRMAYAWCHNRATADDLVQEASLRALENASKLRDVDAADAWVFAILANCHRSHLRRTGSEVEQAHTSNEPVDDGEDPERLADQDALVKRVHAAIARLNDEQRKVITLVDLEGFSYAEVATILQVPVGTIMSRLSRARQRMKKLVRPLPSQHAGQIVYLKENK